VKNALGAKLASKCGIDIGPSIPIIELTREFPQRKHDFIARLLRRAERSGATKLRAESASSPSASRDARADESRQ